jgi:predicted ribonuclease YlaK
MTEKKPTAIYKFTEHEVITLMLALEDGIKTGRERKEKKAVKDMMALFERLMLDLAMAKMLWDEQSDGKYLQ